MATTGPALALAILVITGRLVQAQQSTPTINWTECPEALTLNATAPLSCASFPVPLDYTAPDSSETLNLSLVKVPAVKEPVLGSVLTNFGGPGVASGTYLASVAAQMLVTTGGQYDVVGFDPRGNGNTLPISCWTSASDLARFLALAPYGTNASDTAVGSLWALAQTNAQACVENNPEIIELMGTGFLARDTMQIVDALEEDGLLRYYGHSYGTFVGETLAAMFPDRIERMVLDAVVNPFEYADGWEYQSLEAVDAAVDLWIAQCIEAGYPACEVAIDAPTEAALREKIFGLIETVRNEPISLGGNITTDIVGPAQILIPFDSILRQPLEGTSPVLAAYLQAIFDRNITTYRAVYPIFNPQADTSNILSIRCSDALHRTDSIENIRPRVELVHQRNLIWGQTYAPAYITCSAWKVKAKGRYEGDYRAATKSPVLLVGSPYDLRTPLVSAFTASEVLEGSVVLQHNGLGHTVLSSPGQCTIKAMQAYFVNGTLPDVGTVCEQDFGAFSGRTSAESYDLESL